MTSTKVAVLLGLGVLGLLCYLAVEGFTAVTEILVTLGALVAMISGGSWLTGKFGIYGRGGRGARSAGPAAAAGHGAVAGSGTAAGLAAAGPDVREPAATDRYCPGADLAGRGHPAAAPDAGR